MKLKFKVQPYQTYAVDALADCFAGYRNAELAPSPARFSVDDSHKGTYHSLFGTY